MYIYKIKFYTSTLQFLWIKKKLLSLVLTTVEISHISYSERGLQILWTLEGI